MRLAGNIIIGTASNVANEVRMPNDDTWEHQGILIIVILTRTAVNDKVTRTIINIKLRTLANTDLNRE